MDSENFGCHIFNTDSTDSAQLKYTPSLPLLVGVWWYSTSRNSTGLRPS